MSQPRSFTLDQIFDTHLQTLATTLRHQTVACYHSVANRFLRYLHVTYPEIKAPAQLHRDPHMLGWIRSLGKENPPLTNRTRRACLICLRRLLDDLADNGHPIEEGLIVRQDIPPRDIYLPKPLSPEIDRLLDRELRRTDDLCSNALLLLRATGMRIGECLRLHTDCLRHLGQQEWALHVPLGKLHNERWVPVDEDARNILARILSLRETEPPTTPSEPQGALLTLPKGRRVSYYRMREALNDAVQQAGCSTSIRPHQLRHTYATEMLRAGVSLPALQQWLGHKDIRMTLGYIQVTQNDLQREYHSARQKMGRLYAMPQLSIAPAPETNAATGILAICHALATARHLLEMYRRQLSHQQVRRKLERLANRMVKISTELRKLANAEK